MTLHALVRTAGWMLGHRLARDVRTETALARRLQDPVVTRLRIAVLGCASAVGATTVTALLALVLARYRAENVLAVDGRSGRARDTGPAAWGALEASGWEGTESAEGASGAEGRADLAERLGVEPTAAATLAGGVNARLTQVRAGLWLRPAGSDSLRASGRSGTSAADHSCALTVMDAGTAVGRSDGPPGGTVAGSAGRVLVVPSSPDGLTWARDTLGLIAHGRHPLAPTDIVVLDRSGGGRLDGLDDLTKAATGLGVRIAHLGFDQHLAEGGALRSSEIADATRWTLSQLAADLLAGPTRAVRYALN